MDNELLLSVSVVTYNQMDYIKQCLDGILMQQTHFDFEIILGEDESTDGTREICIEYAKRYPNKIKLFLRSRKDVIYINGNATGRFNMIENLKSCKGKYIALCEGDDYWTDPLKLQKQVDFLEANKDFNICFHRANTLQNGEFKPHEIPNSFNNEQFHYVELLRYYNFISTASVMYRKPKNFKLPNWFHSISFGDLGLYKLISQEKKIQCLEDVMSVYRIHNEGIFSGLSQLIVQQNYLSFYKTIFFILNAEEQGIVRIKVKQLLSKIANEKQPDSLLKRKLYFYMLRMQNRVYI
jgi:glycosyltransferase involved in cell wall biosynthesis